MTSTAMLFPGQGSQSVGMLAELASESELVEATFGEASEVLGRDLWRLCQDGPESELNRTEVTQPCVLAGDIATWRVWCAAGGAMPTQMAGHSLGEYAALVAAGSLEFTAAVALVAERGRLMQAAVPEGEGSMAAVLGMDDKDLQALCEAEARGQVVSCANFNAPGQVVIAGHRTAVERVCEAAKAAGAKRAMVLPVSVPSHCSLMQDAAAQLANSLAALELTPPGVPVVQNADVTSFRDPDAIRAALARQLWQPVQWTRTIQHLAGQGVTRFVECGPGRVLSGLNRRINRDAESLALNNLDSIRAATGAERS